MIKFLAPNQKHIIDCGYINIKGNLIGFEGMTINIMWSKNSKSKKNNYSFTSKFEKSYFSSMPRQSTLNDLVEEIRRINSNSSARDI